MDKDDAWKHSKWLEYLSACSWPGMVMKESSGRWMTLRYNDKSGRNEPDAVFRIEAMTEY